MNMHDGVRERILYFACGSGACLFVLRIVIAIPCSNVFVAKDRKENTKNAILAGGPMLLTANRWVNATMMRKLQSTQCKIPM
jgi:hypothetical protein